MEPKRRGRPPKPRTTGILTDAQITEIKSNETPAQKTTAEAREQERLRGIERRAAAKNAKTFGSIETMEALWAHNRELLSESELNDLLTKDQHTHDLWNWIELVLEGSDISRDPDWPTMEVGIAAMNAHVKNFGVCNPEIALIEQYWKKPDLYDSLKGGTESFAKWGLFICLPEIRVLQLREMVPQQSAQPKAQSGNGYTTLACKCGGPPDAVSQLLADRYEELGITYRCQRCRDLERKSRAQSAMYGGSR